MKNIIELEHCHIYLFDIVREGFSFARKRVDHDQASAAEQLQALVSDFPWKEFFAFQPYLLSGPALQKRNACDHPDFNPYKV